MQVRGKPAPSLAAGRRAEQEQGVISTQNYSTPIEAVCLAVFKRGRWCTVAKLTRLNGSRELVLAVVHRHQTGTTRMISFTLSTLDYAKRAGVRWVYFRRDTSGDMFRMPLTDVERLGHFGPSIGGGEAERYIEISKMDRVPWCDWQWADQIVRLSRPTSDPPEPEGRQLGFGEGF